MKNPKPPRAILTVIFAASVFCILLITMLLLSGVFFLLVRAGVLDEAKIGSLGMTPPLAFFAATSVVIGTIVAAMISRVPLRPVQQLIIGLNRLANGDYDARMKADGPPLGKDVANSFNTLASELQNTEMLRADFVNNFSHEFKTPVVSIRGFAKLLQKETVSDTQRQEYLAIIMEESSRLADMATNVLNLTKVENQSILTNVTRFNLSEQIRNCVLLLEKKWAGKKLTMNAAYDEYDIDADEELLKQVWINLIDNAIKFSPVAGEVGVSITRKADRIIVSVKNNGPAIREADQQHIFRKYWQGDTSHASEGTGIGLSIAKRIITLHKGAITMNSLPEETVFFVELPVRQTKTP